MSYTLHIWAMRPTVFLISPSFIGYDWVTTMVWNWVSHFAHYGSICVNAQVRLWGQRVILRAESSGLRYDEFYSPVTQEFSTVGLNIWSLGNFSLFHLFVLNVRSAQVQFWKVVTFVFISMPVLLWRKKVALCVWVSSRRAPPSTICLDFSFVIWLKGWFLSYLHTELESKGLWALLIWNKMQWAR